MSSVDLRSLLGSRPDSPALKGYISSIPSKDAIPQVKSYHDAVYFNYHKFGLSLLFSPRAGYKPASGLKLEEIKNECLALDSIYIYNTPKTTADGTASRSVEAAFSSYPISPLVLTLSPNIKDKDGKPVDRPPHFHVTLTTTGKEFVEALREPDRKGGGAGPSSGSIGIWCEWSKDGIMVEFGGIEARGPQAWERGKDAIWKIVTIFSPAC